jgi:molecular chaperone Hsp33
MEDRFHRITTADRETLEAFFETRGTRLCNDSAGAALLWAPYYADAICEAERERVLKAGGLLIQPLPGCPDDIIDQIELRSPMFSDISREMTFAPKEELLEDWFRGMDLQILERAPLRYHCACSRYRMEKALISLGRRELQTIIDEDTGAELGCHFCHSQYAFSTDDLKELLAHATRD